MNERDENGGLGLQAGELYFQDPDGQIVHVGTITDGTLTSAGAGADEEVHGIPEVELPIGHVDVTAIRGGPGTLTLEPDGDHLFVRNATPGAQAGAAIRNIINRFADNGTGGAFTWEATTAEDADPRNAVEEFEAALNEATRMMVDNLPTGTEAFTPERFEELARRVAELRNAPVGTTVVMPTRDTVWGRGRGYDVGTYVVDEDAGMGYATIHTADGDTIVTEHDLTGEYTGRAYWFGENFNRRYMARPITRAPETAIGVYCAICNSFTIPRVFDQNETVFVYGVRFRYPKKVAYCECCGAVVSVPGIDEQNREALKNARLAT